MTDDFDELIQIREDRHYIMAQADEIKCKHSFVQEAKGAINKSWLLLGSQSIIIMIYNPVYAKKYLTD